MGRLALPLLGTLLLASVVDAADSATATRTTTFMKPALGLTVVAGEVDLPAPPGGADREGALC
jgi:hypothetical protein